MKKPASPPSLKSNLRKLDQHRIARREYEELPELTEESLSRAVVRKRGRPLTKGTRKLISLRLPVFVLEKWQASGPGWQTRMVTCLTRSAPREGANTT